MKITKYEHACFVVEEDGESLIVDPGGWTTDLVIPDTVVGVIITHEHQDHIKGYDPDIFKNITNGSLWMTAAKDPEHPQAEATRSLLARGMRRASPLAA